MLHRIALLAVSSLGSVLLAAGCSGSTTGEGGATPVPSDQFVARFVDAVCDNIGACCQKSGFAYDPAACKAMGNAELGKEFDPNQPNMVYDASAAGSCVAAVKNAAASCGAFDLDSSTACDAVFKGTLPEGATCDSTEQCADPVQGKARCEYPDGAQTGKCVLSTRGKSGEPCAATCTELGGGGTDCLGSSEWTGTAQCYTNDGLYCDGTCKPTIAVGQTCKGDDCVLGAYCNDGKCVTAPGPGSACAMGYLCAAGSACDASGTCQSPKPNGQPCSGDDECASHQCSSGVCAEDSLANASLCGGTK